MEAVKLTEAWFQGALSVEYGDGWLKPWRLPHHQAPLFASPDNSLMGKGEMPSGVRLRFETDATTVELAFKPLAAEPLKRDHFFDLTLNNDLIASAPSPAGGTQARFVDLPAGPKVLEIWLPSCHRRRGRCWRGRGGPWPPGN